MLLITSGKRGRGGGGLACTSIRLGDGCYSKVKAQARTDRRTDRQTDRQAGSTPLRQFTM
jgi:hypothetical protein